MTHILTIIIFVTVIYLPPKLPVLYNKVVDEKYKIHLKGNSKLDNWMLGLMLLLFSAVCIGIYTLIHVSVTMSMCP